MPLWQALYHTYQMAEEAGLVDEQTKHGQPKILPIFHSDKKSISTEQIIEITINSHSKAIAIRDIEENNFITYPVTIDSVGRSGSGPLPHALADEAQYLCSHFNDKKYNEYLKGLEEWIEFSRLKSLNIIYKYILTEDIRADFERFKNTELKAKQFITFAVVNEAGEKITVSDSQELHQDYINFVRQTNQKLEMGYCDVSGVYTKISYKHRPSLGMSRIITGKAKVENYRGRFSEDKALVKLGFETSEKIFLMLRYFMNSQSYKRNIGDNTYLVVWNSQNINEEPPKFTNQKEEEDFGFDEYLTLLNNGDSEHDNESNVRSFNFNQEIAKNAMNYITGSNEVSDNGEYYVLILNKVSNGRMSLKYFRKFSGSELSNRVINWYATTNWATWNGNELINRSPNLFLFVNRIYGTETLEKGKHQILIRNDKIVRQNIEKLLLCILEGRKLPLDMMKKLNNAIYHREKYRHTWDQLENTALSAIKKFNFDYKGEVVQTMLDENNNDSSYIIGRIMAVMENIEFLANADFTRQTLVVKYWNQITIQPLKALQKIKAKLLPYENRLNRNKPGAGYNRANLLEKLFGILGENESFMSRPNSKLSEVFLVGYYAQKQALRTSKDDKVKLAEKEN